MVKLKEPVGRVKEVKYVYDSDEPSQANFIGMFSLEGKPVTDREIKGKYKPEDYLFASSPKGRNTVPKEEANIEAHSLIINKGMKNERTGYWFSYE